MSEINIRPAEPADLVAVAEIYAHSVHTSVATFDVQEPSRAYWQAKLDRTAVGDHFLVAHSSVAGDEDHVLGFTYSGAFRPRPPYARPRGQ